MRVAVLLILLVGGCLAADAPRAPATLVFDRAALVDPSVGGSEPRIVIATDGRLYVSAMRGNTQDSAFGLPYASRLWVTQGEGWQRLDPVPRGPLDATAGGGDSDVATGPEGQVLVVDAWAGADAAAFSRDGGVTWNWSAVSSEIPFHDRPWVAIDDAGRGYVMARTFLPAAAEWVARTDDGGRSWRNVGRAWTMDAGTGTGATNGNLLATDGVLVTPFTCLRGLCVATSTDQGETWTRERAVEGDIRATIFPVIAGDQRALSLVWSDGAAVWLARRDGVSWSEPEQVSPAGGTHILPWVDARAGRIAVAWYATDTEGDPNDAAAMRDAHWDVRVARCEDTCLGASAVEDVHRGTVNTQGIAPGPDAPDWTLGDLLSVALDRRGCMHVAFTTGDRDAPRVGVADERC